MFLKRKSLITFYLILLCGCSICCSPKVGLVVLVGWSGWLGDSRHQGKGWKSPLYHSVPRKPYHTELYPAILNWLCQRGGSFRAPPRMPYDTAISHSKEREGRDHLGSVPGTLPPTVLKPLKDRKVTSNKYHL